MLDSANGKGQQKSNRSKGNHEQLRNGETTSSAGTLKRKAIDKGIASARNLATNILDELLFDEKNRVRDIVVQLLIEDGQGSLRPEIVNAILEHHLSQVLLSSPARRPTAFPRSTNV